jgi:hypothetical protein
VTAFTASALVHQHRRDFVFPDGVVLGDAIDAIHAAGTAENYVLAGQLKIQYALDVCTRCACIHQSPKGSRVELPEYGIDAFGTICHLCELEFLAMGRQRRHL